MHYIWNTFHSLGAPQALLQRKIAIVIRLLIKGILTIYHLGILLAKGIWLFKALI